MNFPISNSRYNPLKQGSQRHVQLGNVFWMDTKIFTFLTSTTPHATSIVTMALCRSVLIRSPSTALEIAGGQRSGSQGPLILHPCKTTENKSCALAHHASTTIIHHRNVLEAGSFPTCSLQK